jgi:predicted dehydrogenase
MTLERNVKSTARTDRVGTATRIALVGAGRFAHLYHVPPLNADPRARLTIICDPAPSAQTEALAKEWGIPIAADITDALRSETCDAVLISTPHHLHAAQVKAAMSAGKHVLVDKPFVLTSSEARALVQLARRRKLVGAVAFNRRFANAYLHARDVIRGGKLGAIRLVETVQLGGSWVVVPDGSAPRAVGAERPAWYLDSRAAGGGVLLGRGAHMADAVPWLLGRRPKRLRAQVRAGRKGDVDNGGTIDIDFGDFLWRFTTLADTARLWDDLRVYGAEGRIEVRKPEGTLGDWEAVHESFGGQRLDAPAPGVEGTALGNFLDSIEGVAEPRCTFEDAWLSVRIIEAAYRSAKATGTWVAL